jgi:hypothetical protein
MSIQDAVLYTMGLTNYIKDIYYHIVDLKQDNIENLPIVLDELDGILLKMNQLISIQSNIFSLDDRDMVYFLDDIQFIYTFLSEWRLDKISLIAQKDYCRLEGQLKAIKDAFP